ncbi:DUF397 domain-containing protein [Kitasatospora sp. NPDC096147]|uniref:DUF397 domain-containing protein n=1 Tax=Kitasatospora sp. NPDC096147 TaxID=3364093 RepID=UPI00381B6344
MTVNLTGAVYRSSSYSGNGGNCIEPALNLVTPQGIVPVRDSKDPEGPSLVFPVSSWAAFASAVAAGEFGTV